MKHFSEEEEELSQESTARVELRNRKKKKSLFSVIIPVLSKSGCSSLPWFGGDS